MTRNVVLNDGGIMPLMGLGVMLIPEESTTQTIQEAVQLGYRLFDTSPVYGNEAGVGQGIKDCGLAREGLFVTSKLWNENQGYDQALKAFDQSIKALALDYLDLYLIHWPVPTKGLYVESWRALIRLREEGRVRSIGVSNFMTDHLERIIAETGVAPVVNQIEHHPFWQQREARGFGQKHAIITQAWSPLGRGASLSDPEIVAMAARNGCSPAQLILRWMTQLGIATIPKASSARHMRENLASMDFQLDDAALSALNNLDNPLGRIGPNPYEFETLSVN